MKFFVMLRRYLYSWNFCIFLLFYIALHILGFQNPVYVFLWFVVGTAIFVFFLWRGHF